MSTSDTQHEPIPLEELFRVLFPIPRTPKGGALKKDRLLANAQRAFVLALIISADSSRATKRMLEDDNEALVGENEHLREKAEGLDQTLTRTLEELRAARHQLEREKLHAKAETTMRQASDATKLGVRRFGRLEKVVPELIFEIGGLLVTVDPMGEYVYAISTHDTPIKIRRQRIRTFGGKLDYAGIGAFRTLVKAVTDEGYKENRALLDEDAFADLYESR